MFAAGAAQSSISGNIAAIMRGLKIPSDNKNAVIDALGFRKQIGNTKVDAAADDLDQGEHLFRLPGSDLERESDVDRLWTAAVKFYDDILKNRSTKHFDKATTPAVAKLLHKYLHELHELMRDSRSDAMIDAMTTFIRRHQPSTSMPARTSAAPSMGRKWKGVDGYCLLSVVCSIVWAQILAPPLVAASMSAQNVPIAGRLRKAARLAVYAERRTMR